jgi:hypothetical protein
LASSRPDAALRADAIQEAQAAENQPTWPKGLFTKKMRLKMKYETEYT